MTRTLGVGVLGMGWMGQLHSASYQRLKYHYPDVNVEPRLVIAADPDEGRQQMAVDRLGFAESTANWKDVLSHPDVDVVSITTPNFLHREMAVATAEAGKPFWAEKPLGRYPSDVADVGEAVEQAGVITMVGFNYRYAPALQRARELIAEGALGEITHYRSTFIADYSSHPDGVLTWRFSFEQAGLGILGDLMSHAADMALYVLGPIERLTAQRAVFIPTRPKSSGDAESHFARAAEDAEHAPVENEDYVSALLHFAGGARGTIETSRVVVGPHVRYVVEAHGTEGAVAWNFERMNELRLYERRNQDAGYRTVYAEPGHGDFAHFQPAQGIGMSFDDLKVMEAHQFVSSVVSGEQLPGGVPDAVAMMQVISAMERSCESGVWEDVGEITPSMRMSVEGVA
ncbi:MAG: Gfo/Idh/MocA family protein [Egibacteraceae bacterium]